MIKDIDWMPVLMGAVIAMSFLLLIFAADKPKRVTEDQYFEIVKLAIEKGWTPEQIKTILIKNER